MLNHLSLIGKNRQHIATFADRGVEVKEIEQKIRFTRFNVCDFFSFYLHDSFKIYVIYPDERANKRNIEMQNWVC